MPAYTEDYLPGEHLAQYVARKRREKDPKAFRMGDRVIAPCPIPPYKRTGTIVNFASTIPAGVETDLAMVHFDPDETGFEPRWTCYLSSLKKL